MTMRKKYHKIPVKGDKALEMTMQNVLDSLEDSASYFGFQSTPDTLEILSIERPKGDPLANHQALATVHHVYSNKRSENVVDFLITREQQAQQLRI